MHHSIHRDRPASGEGEIGFGLSVSVGLQRVTFWDANHPHGDVVLTPRDAAEQLLPLGLAPHSDLLAGPTGPFHVIEVFGGCLHQESTFNR